MYIPILIFIDMFLSREQSDVFLANVVNAIAFDAVIAVADDVDADDVAADAVVVAE